MFTVPVYRHNHAPQGVNGGCNRKFFPFTLPA
uniref:Uncharacterized protein n=1 Tax=Myoviridae sp. ctiu99 TaxID=2825158 RepID=A0A8S5NVM4_9CAUD|nr:MAG TPA: hypothetical protein [Myoviridae sp. ctiu99]DAJ16594.1 MAG TPA: hypothetical protein [Siphoviridae sp. ct2ef27]